MRSIRRIQCGVGVGRHWRTAAVGTARLAGVLAATAAMTFGLAGPVVAQDASPVLSESPYEGYLVEQIRIDGLERVTDQWVRNNINTAVGRPLSTRILETDLRQLQRLDQFEDVSIGFEVLPERRVAVVISVVEAPVITDVSVVGNREVPDEVLAAAVNLFPDAPIDEYQIGRAVRAIEALYRERGYYQVEVRIDQDELQENGVLLFRIREGPRVQVTAIRFDGADSFTEREIRPELKTRTRGIFNKAPLDEETLRVDVAAIINFYLDRGYLDVRADREIRISPDGSEAIITFLVDEGRRYTLRDVVIRRLGADADAAEGGLSVFSARQLAGLMDIKTGDVYSLDRLRRSVEAVEDAYSQLGYIDVVVRREELRDPDRPEVDLLLRIEEGERYRTGLVRITGNTVSKAKVPRREIELQPDRPLDGTKLEESRRELDQLRLFAPGSVKLTPQPPADYDRQYRDILVELEDTDTGRITFGAAVNSDAGLTGALSLEQRNFDIADVPESFDELLSGESFRGAGQRFQAQVAPGTEVSTYSLSLTEPYLFETPYSLGGTIFFREREYDEYDEERYGGRLRLGRRFGTRWTGGFFTRIQSVELSDIEDSAPVDVFEVADQHFLTSLGIDLQRTTVDNRFRPTRGTRTEIELEQVGALGGDFDFTRLQGEFQIFLPVIEDFLGRTTVLSLKTTAAYIPQEDEAPVYERFYLGGRSFRGFDFRGIGPLGVKRNGNISNEHVGGDFSFFFGAEIERPVWEDMVAVVGFVDTGTVNDDFGFENYRVAVGAGIRLYLPFFGAAPLAFDFGFPILKEDGDESRVFSFTFDLPF